MPWITINGRRVAADDGMTVLDAALRNGIEIPHLCDYPMLEKFAGCRMCLVSVAGHPKLVASCTLKPEEGMVIETETPDVQRARKAVTEFMLINHPLECPSCDKAGMCSLQEYAVRYGAASGRFEEKKIVKSENSGDPLIARNMGRCIMCTRCVRTCTGVQGANALAPVGRGNTSVIEPFAGDSFSCEYCGNCLSVCPVGALTSRLHRYGARPWDMDKRSRSICPHCGTGCQVTVESRKGSIQRVSPRSGDRPGACILCARGSFGYGFVASPQRLTSPLIREGGRLRRASWEEALRRVSEGFLEIKRSYGGSAIAGVASVYCTNEDDYMLQRLMRTAFGTNNIDSPARLGIAGSRPFIEGILGPGARAAAVSDVPASDAVLVLGGDPVSEMPVAGVKVRNAFMKGATVITFGHTPGLARHSTFSFDGQEWLAVEALLAQVLKRRRPRGEDSALEELTRKLELPEPEDMPNMHHAEDIARAAEMLESKRSVTIIAGCGAAAHRHGARNLLVISALAHALGAGLVLSSEGPNENGLLDMGCTPDRLPGGAAIDDRDAKAKFEEAWGCTIPGWRGLSLMEMFEAAHAGAVRAMYVMGSNPAASLPCARSVRGALEGLDMLVVQDILMTETARMADVVLPAAGWAEKEGTYTNVERTVVHMEKALDTDLRPDWTILAELSSLCGVDAEYSSAEDVMAEAAGLVPGYGGVAYAALRTGRRFKAGGSGSRNSLDTSDYEELCKKPPAEGTGDYHLIVEKSIVSPGTLCRHSDALMSVSAFPSLLMNSETAAGLALKQGDIAEVITDCGSMRLTVRLIPSLSEKTVALADIGRTPRVLELFQCHTAGIINTSYAHISGLRILTSPPASFLPAHHGR
ncbi:MAG: molybdopterin-dependent oxidoreductase [Nitrospirota bacterium]